jgi:hypothetical protein
MNMKVSKSDEIVKHIKEWVDHQYEHGRVSSIADEELEKLVGEFQSK